MAYLISLAVEAFKAEVAAGRLPLPITVAGRERWSRRAVVQAVEAFAPASGKPKNVQATPSDQVRVHTPATLAKHWGCSERHIRNLIASGDLGHLKLGGKLIRIPIAEVSAYENRGWAPAPK
jgi:excisionase family DNA binding protein